MSDQGTFRAGLLNPAIAAPAGLADNAGRAAGNRYDVYRNNVTHSLLEALRVAFPLPRRLLGARHFDQVALAFARAHPPTSPVMMFYGDQFPAFLARVPALNHMGFLPDAARLDLALRKSYHAADVDSLTAQRLTELSPDALESCRLTPAPATFLIRSDWPLYDIWRSDPQAEPRDWPAHAQTVAITRPGYDPAPHLLDDGAAEWLEALADGQTLNEAHQKAIDAHPAFNFSAALTLALETGMLMETTTRTKYERTDLAI